MVSAGGCPPPLAWQDVLGSFLRESDAWYLDRNGYQIHGRMWGHGPPLYFLPGFGGTLDLYALLVWLLRDEFRCVLLDYPVHPGRTTIGTFAEDVFAVADRCGDTEIDLFASSFGSLVGIEALLAQRGRIRRALLQGAFAHRTLSGVERGLALVGRVMPGRLRHVPLRRWLQSEIHRRWFPPFDATRFQFLLDNTGQVPLAALGERARVVHRTDLRARLGEVRNPVLLIQGEGEGTIAERCLKELAAGLPQARIERLHNTGQLPYLTHPHRVAKLVREFLKGADE